LRQRWRRGAVEWRRSRSPASGWAAAASGLRRGRARRGAVRGCRLREGGGLARSRCWWWKRPRKVLRVEPDADGTDGASGGSRRRRRCSALSPRPRTGARDAHRPCPPCPHAIVFDLESGTRVRHPADDTAGPAEVPWEMDTYIRAFTYVRREKLSGHCCAIPRSTSGRDGWVPRSTSRSNGHSGAGGLLVAITGLPLTFVSWRVASGLA
jgi:hypothetical protein